MLGSVYNISHYCACSRKLTCTTSIEHCISQHISMYKDCIKYIIHTVKWTVPADQEGSYHCITGTICISAACAQKFNGSAQLCSILHILRCNFCDALCINILIIKIFTICQRRQDCYFAACIISLYICCGICFRVTLLLCFL